MYGSYAQPKKRDKCHTMNAKKFQEAMFIINLGTTLFLNGQWQIIVFG